MKGKKIIAAFMAVVMVMSLLPAVALADEPTEETPVQQITVAETVSDAILYQINASGELEYNVTHTAPVSADAVVTGEGIDSLAALESTMGVIDKPATELSTDPGERTIGKAVTADLGLDAEGNVVQIAVTDVRERPIIGISWKKNSIGSDYQGFAEAYERNGAIAVFLPQVTSAGEAREVLADLDGIFFTGGEDWNPSLYDEVQSPHGSSGWNDARDTSDINLMQQAIDMDVPLFAVCRGEQGFNVAMGGGLIQDIPYYLGQKVLAGEIDPDRVTKVMSGTLPGSEPVADTGYTYYNENYEKVGPTYDKTAGTYAEYDTGCEKGHLQVQVDGLVHGGSGYHVLDAGTDGIGVSKDSKWLYDIVGAETIDLVATAHHQAVNPEKLGNGLTIVAKSSDGIVEAIEHQDSLFALAVQFHPERDALKDTRGVDVDNDLCNAFLGALVEYAGIYQDSKPENPDPDPEPEDPEFNPNVTYETAVTDAERTAIHSAVENLTGYVGDMKVGDGTYDPNTLIGGLATGSSYNSISYGSRNAGSIPSEYPFAVPDTENNNNEGSRKTSKFAWVKELAENLGFEVVQRQDDKYVYVEIGDPDAPEMVMALSHLDSPTASNSPTGNLNRWVNAEGELDPTAYYTPYVKDGWLYGAGVQDDSGPTLATLFAAKALVDSGVKFDRRIRIVMGAYEDSNPGVPSVADTLSYMDIPYYTSNPSFYDNWSYKSLNREETPIAAYTSDSRFPVVVGNSQAWTPVVTMDLSADEGRAFNLVSAAAGVTLREGDPTLKDIVYGSTSQVASRALFTLSVAGADAEAIQAFKASIEAAATERGWLPVEAGTTPKVAVTVDEEANTVTLEVNTDVAMEMPTPQYGKNAVVWGMYLLSQALPEGLQLKKAADGISALFFRNCVEGEAYIGKYMGIPADLLRNPDDGTANLTFALMGGIRNTVEPVSFFENGALSIPMYVRSMHANKEDYDTATAAVVQAWTDKGFQLLTTSGGVSTPTAFKDPTLYLSHDNLLTALQFASYKASIEYDPDEFSGPYDLLDITYPVGTTGGTLATNFRNKMTAFGAVIPGNERWWHSANERISVDSIVEMTKMMADGMLEMARYSGSAGAQLMWADIEGLNADRADLDLLDVTVGTYQDASGKISAQILGDEDLVGATSFEIHMWADRGNTSKTAAQYAAGHAAGGVYLPLDNEDFLANTFVLPMRLEFKYERPADMTDAEWNSVISGSVGNFAFNLLKDGEVIPLVLPEGSDAAKFYSIRVDENDPDTAYVAVNLAITDAPYDGVSTVLADSKTDLYSLNSQWLETHEDPFPQRGAVEERGFFLFGDGTKNACFESPDAIYVTTNESGQVATANVRFTYPESIPADAVELELYKGYPTSSSRTLEQMTSGSNPQLTKVTPVGTGLYQITEPGVYSYHVSGEGYYNILKIVNITEEDIANGKTIEVVGGPLGSNDGAFGDGYQPTVKPSQAPDTYKMDARDAMLCIWPDEVLEHFTTENTTHDQEYKTPAFDGTDAAHEFTTQEELMAFMKDRDASCDYMYLYSAGETPNYHFDIPLSIFTQTEIPAGATLEEAAALVKANGKPTVWYQTQIHPNEPAAGEGALVVIDDFINDPEVAALLDTINVVIVPRINPDGSYLFSRATYDGFDMNRDHMSLKAAELAQLHTAYRLFMAEVTLDGHEFTFYGASKDSNGAYMSNAYDLETTPATSLNDDPAVTKIALEMCGETFDNARAAGLRVYHYGTTVNNPIGRAYFGLYNALSFLIETRGIGAGKTNFERRVFSQETAILSYITYTAQHADEIKEVVAAARAAVVEKGKTYDEGDLLALYQTKSGNTQTEYVGYNTQYYLNGELKREEPATLSLNDTMTRSRVRPTAYVIPADLENIDTILYILDNQGAEYFRMPTGSTIDSLQQYYYVGSYAKGGIEADLRETASVTFDNGAYVIPMDQVAGNVIGMLMEPDVTDSNGYDGTLYQYKQVDYDKTTNNFPIYRYIGNDPRTALDLENLDTVVDTTVSGAILYQINADGELEYNVTHTAPMGTSVTVSGRGINSLAALESTMGVIDKPATVLSTDPGQRTIGKAVTADLGLNADGEVISVKVTAVSDRPIIGISWKKDTIGSDYQGFAEAYERNGAIAVYLPQVTSASQARDVLADLDGIFFTGGEDWNPSLYDEVQSPHGSSGWNDARDISDINLMQQAIKMDVPLFAVCRGEQGFNVAMGGGLIQDIPYYLGQKVLAGEIDPDRVTNVMSGTLPGSDPVKDTGYTYYNENYEKVGRTYDSKTGTYAEYDTGCEEGHLRVQVDGLIHSGGTGYHVLDAEYEGIGVSKDSKWLYDIVGAETIDLVATAHHQAVNPEKLGNGLTIVAKSSDGIVEAIEHQDSLFALAVQFHPERDALKDTRGVDVDNDLCNAFLGALVKYAGIYAAQNSGTGSGSSGGGSGSSTYVVSISSSANGKVTASPKNASQGTTVTLTVTPDAGYQLDTLTVTDKNGKAVSVTEKNGKYTFTMPAGAVTVKATFEETTSTGGGWPFTDVPASYWAYDSIKAAYEKGYMNGKSATIFQPDGSVTRQQLWMILARLSGAAPADMAAARDWAMSNNISDGTNPGNPVTRQQMVAILYRYATLKGYDVSGKADLTSFPDSASVADYAKDAMAWSVANSIVAGTSDGTLNPTGTATRAQFATILMRFCDKMVG